MFAKQAKLEGRDAKFLGQSSARYFAKWPIPCSTNMGAEIKRIRMVSPQSRIVTLKVDHTL
jgi:hypothetical protein